MQRLYKVTFNRYTNYNKNAVSDGKKYIDTDEPLIIREDQIDGIRRYGNGIRQLEYIGVLYE